MKYTAYFHEIFNFLFKVGHELTLTSTKYLFKLPQNMCGQMTNDHYINTCPLQCCLFDEIELNGRFSRASCRRYLSVYKSPFSFIVCVYL